MDNKNLKAFHGELKELLKKYNVALDIKAEIVAADLSAINQKNAPSTEKPVELV